MAACVNLERLNCTVDQAATGKDAIQKATAHHYDLIFMDMGLPDHTGIEVTQTIRALPDPQKAQVPIVGLTGHAGDTQHQACLNAGMNAVLTKPAQFLTFQSTLQQWVGDAETRNRRTR